MSQNLCSSSVFESTWCALWHFRHKVVLFTKLLFDLMQLCIEQLIRLLIVTDSYGMSAMQAGPVVDAGGIFEYARQTGMIKTAAA